MKKLKKIGDILVFLFCMVASLVLLYFGVCYFNIMAHNLDPNGYVYPEWNLLAQSIEEAGQ